MNLIDLETVLLEPSVESDPTLLSMRPFAPSVNEFQPIRREPRNTMSNPTTQVPSDAFSAPRRHLQREDGSDLDLQSRRTPQVTRGTRCVTQWAPSVRCVPSSTHTAPVGREAVGAALVEQKTATRKRL